MEWDAITVVTEQEDSESTLEFSEDDPDWWVGRNNINGSGYLQMIYLIKLTNLQHSPDRLAVVIPPVKPTFHTGLQCRSSNAESFCEYWIEFLPDSALDN